MTILRETVLIFRNAAVVTSAVILGFAVGGALGMPSWLQAFCLVPAALLFYRLSGEARPAWWKLLGFMGVLSVLALLFTMLFPLIPERHQTLAFILLLIFAPFQPVTRWIGTRLFNVNPNEYGPDSKL